ncbi:hypothetical protein THIOSC15_2640006 [uncultured Thiomicrorhabdus sp.]
MLNAVIQKGYSVNKADNKVVIVNNVKVQCNGGRGTIAGVLVMLVPSNLTKPDIEK